MIFLKVIALFFLINCTDSRRVLLMQVDNRELNEDINSPILDYFSLAAVINFEYAKKHGYDFLVFNVNNTNAAIDVAAKYGNSSYSSAIATVDDILNVKKMGWASQSKMELSVFHNTHKYFRATPWAKIAVLWNLAVIIHSKIASIDYDYIFYIDSDFVLNPNFHDRSLDDAFKTWAKSSPLVEKTAFTFFSNAPYSHRPCTGGIVANMKHGLIQGLIKAWWDVHIPYNNFAHEYEQAALWKMMDENHEIKHNQVYLHGERQFPPCNDLWVCHLGHPWKEERMATLHEMTEKILQLTPSAFSERIKYIASEKTVFVHAFPISDVIEDPISKTNLATITAFANRMKEKLAPIQPSQETAATVVKNSSVVDPVSNSGVRVEDYKALPLVKRAFLHQFPASCKGKTAVVLHSFQNTGLGTLIYLQAAKLLKRAMDLNAILIIHPDSKSPYFEGCPAETYPKHAGRWTCLFQPVTKCSLADIDRVVLSVNNSQDIDAVVNTGGQATADELISYSSFLSRPSDIAKSLALEIFQQVTRMHHGKDVESWKVTTKIAGIHIRQRSPEGSHDWVRSNTRLWTPLDLIHILEQISKRTNVKHFLIISDDPNLPRLTSNLIEDDATHSKYSFAVAFTTESVLHAARTDRDCLRDNLGCDEKLNIEKAAFASMIDMALISMTHVFAGTMKSIYSKLLVSTVMFNTRKPLLLGVDGFDLDAVCEKDQKTASKDTPCSNLYLP